MIIICIFCGNTNYNAVIFFQYYFSYSLKKRGYDTMITLNHVWCAMWWRAFTTRIPLVSRGQSAK